MASQLKLQPCHNVGANVVSTSVPLLWRHLFVDNSKHSSNIVWHPDNVWTLHQHCISTKIPMLPQHCHNVGQHWDNVEATLCECCHYPMLGNDIETMFRQHCVNIVAMSLSMLGTIIQTTFRQHCVNIVWTLVPDVRDRHWNNVRAT